MSVILEDRSQTEKLEIHFEVLKVRVDTNFVKVISVKALKHIILAKLPFS